MGSTHSSSAFLQWVQRPRNVHEKNGTTKTLIFTNNTVKGKLHPTNPGDDTDNIPAYTPFISGGAGVGNVTITGNNFGDYDHASNCVYGIVFQTVVDGATFNVSNNEAYLANKSSNFLWVGEYLPSKINNVSVNINNNNFYTGTKKSTPPTRPYSLNSTKDIATPSFSVARVNDNLSGKAVSHHNYVNGYCYNSVKLAIIGDSKFDVDEQIGHTDGDGHIHSINEHPLIKKYGIKAEDIYLLNKADEFDGVKHKEKDLGSTQYCDRCDNFLAAAIIKCEGLSPDESAIFSIKDSNGKEYCKVTLSAESPTKAVMGLEAGSYTVEAKSWVKPIPHSQA